MRATAIIFVTALSFFVGCNNQSDPAETSDKFVPIENGFGYGGHSQGFPDRKMWAGLQYQNSTGKMIVVWPYLGNASPAVQITNHLAIMVGGIAEIYEDGVERLRQRLIGFQAPNGTPVDLTDQILLKWCAASGVEFTNITKDPFVSLKKTNDALQIDFVILKRGARGPGDIMAGDGTAIIQWPEIESIIRDVKTNGKRKIEKRSGFQYLQKE